MGCWFSFVSIYGRPLHALGKRHVQTCTTTPVHSVCTFGFCKFHFPATHAQLEDMTASEDSDMVYSSHEPSRLVNLSDSKSPDGLPCSWVCLYIPEFLTNNFYLPNGRHASSLVSSLKQWMMSHLDARHVVLIFIVTLIDNTNPFLTLRKQVWQDQPTDQSTKHKISPWSSPMTFFNSLHLAMASGSPMQCRLGVSPVWLCLNMRGRGLKHRALQQPSVTNKLCHAGEKNILCAHCSIQESEPEVHAPAHL